MTSGIRGSAYEPRAETARRLARWRRLATDGHSVRDIAAALGMERRALDQLTYRARKAGHPDAVLHAHHIPAGTGVGHVMDRSKRRNQPPRAAGQDEQGGDGRG